jgi:uncharacterized protein (TIRG00374 family)
MKRLIPLSISLLILALIYWKIDARAVLAVLRECDVFWLGAGLAMVVPLTMLTAWRFQCLMPPQVRVSFGEANRLILAASTLNMVLPSKMGDIVKAWFMRGKSEMGGGLALSLVVFEKLCDMLALLLWCVIGLLCYENKTALLWLCTVVISTALITGLLFIGSAQFLRIFTSTLNKLMPHSLRARFEVLWERFGEVQSFFWSNKLQAMKVAAVSVFIWFLHLVQISVFVLALKATVPFLSNLAIAPLAILAGLVPLTFAGVGTRDAAVIGLYSPFFAAPIGAALGLLLTARYILPGLFGLPFLNGYLAALKLGSTLDRKTSS